MSRSKKTDIVAVLQHRIISWAGRLWRLNVWFNESGLKMDALWKKTTWQTKTEVPT